MMNDIRANLAELEDIPGTRIFTGTRARAGYHLNQFCMSLMKAENRDRFRANESDYLDEWPLTDEQKKALLSRDYDTLIDLGGNIYFLAKVIFSDGHSFLRAVSTMSGMTLEAYEAMMLAGGRSPEGLLSKKDTKAPAQGDSAAGEILTPSGTQKGS
jgi:protocatechuate 4,5-dioxygenase alpha chain